MSSLQSEIVVVSGLPRSGTSLMMQMLEQGGLPIMTDNERVADPDNPRGYLELEKVKKLKSDASWLPEARGSAVKMISQLLYDLPTHHCYRVIFMERDLEEVLDSQEKMLARLNQQAAPRDRIREAFRVHLERLHQWIKQQSHLNVLLVSYNGLLEDPLREAQRVATFLDARVDPRKMAEAVDPALYRNRKRG
jgi:hypothetical protein